MADSKLVQHQGVPQSRHDTVDDRNPAGDYIPKCTTTLGSFGSAA